MKSKFKCQCVRLDDSDDWFEVEAYDYEDAALDYVARCDDATAGEILNKPLEDKEIVRVMGSDGRIQSFEITMDWSKDYFVRDIGGVN